MNHNPYAFEKVNVSEEEIKNLVHTFYNRVREDFELAPIFNEVIQDKWSVHLEKMCDFWSSSMLMTDRYRGNPMLKHMQVESIQPEHFKRWLILFRKTTNELFTEAVAEQFNNRADRIAEALKSRLFPN
ncbi:MAG: group III truncated hemoglobin [Candidatus Omnitrophica bacterium]|nr:group III truncated hemoglobin [Candidatus Omnitrophota bacterium]